MKILTICMQCQFETGAPNFASFALADIPESGWIEAICDRGHQTATIVEQGKFEILFEMGVNAIVKGFYRDSILSFTTSLERLNEFFIEASLRKQGISPNAFTATWKAMASQSERQLGAFLYSILLATGEIPKTLPPKQVEFRNAVVHKGRFPSREETMQFGAAVFDCALSVLNVLRSDPYAEIMDTLIFERIHERSKHARGAGLQISTMSLNSPLSIMGGQHADFQMIVTSYAKRPDFTSSSRSEWTLI